MLPKVVFPRQYSWLSPQAMSPHLNAVFGSLVLTLPLIVLLQQRALSGIHTQINPKETRASAWLYSSLTTKSTLACAPILMWLPLRVLDVLSSNTTT